MKRVATAVKQYVESGRYAYQRRILSNAYHEGFTAAIEGLTEPYRLKADIHRAERAAYKRGYKAGFQRVRS